MIGKLFKVVVVFLLLFTYLISPISVISQSVTFSAQVGDTVLILRGYTSPNSLVVFQENDSVIGTAASDANGFFDKTFTAQDAGSHTFVIYSYDPNNQITPLLEKSITLIGFTTTEINDLMLSPTIYLNKGSFNRNEEVIVYGYGKPNLLIDILIKGNSQQTVNVTTDPLGYFEYKFLAGSLQAGDYRVEAIIKNNMNEIIGNSFELQFTVRSDTIITPTPSITPTGEVEPTPTVTPVTPTPTLAPTVTPTPPATGETSGFPTIAQCLCCIVVLILLLVVVRLYNRRLKEYKESAK